jgi:hypothetical protein
VAREELDERGKRIWVFPSRPSRNSCMHVCPERKVKRCRRSFCDSCCAGDGGRSSGLAVQAGSPNRRGVMPVKSRGGKRLRNGSLSAGQVRDEKTNMVEPLLTHRKTMTASQPGLVHISGRAPCYFAWCSQGTACVSLWRCSVLIKVASARRRRWHGTGEPVSRNRRPGRLCAGRERENLGRQKPLGAEYREAQGRTGSY